MKKAALLLCSNITSPIFTCMDGLECMKHRQFLTWRVVEHPEVWLLFGQHLEHHLSRSFASAVQHPRAKRLQGTQGGDVNNGAPYTWLLWKRLEHLGSETQGGADVQRQVRVHLCQVSEAFSVARHITQRSYKEKKGSYKHVFVGFLSLPTNETFCQ